MYVSQITNNGPIQTPKIPELYAHERIWDFFPDQMNRDFVYRYNGSDQFYVYSSTVPKVPVGKPWSVQSMQFNPTFSAGNKFSFCSRLNTAKRDENKKIRGVIKQGKECGMGPVDSVTKFFEERASNAFRVDDLGIEEIRIVDFKKKDGNKITIEAVDVIGTLTVVDPAEFTKILFGGIGREKCYGYGMILLN